MVKTVDSGVLTLWQKTKTLDERVGWLKTAVWLTSVIFCGPFPAVAEGDSRSAGATEIGDNGEADNKPASGNIAIQMG